MKIIYLCAVLLISLNSTIAQAVMIDPKFSIDPASPSIDGNITPDDVLKAGPNIHTQGTSLGLLDDFFFGNFDNLNALSYGMDPITLPGETLPIYFSVDRVAVGEPGTSVNQQAAPGVEDAAGDVYRTLPPFGNNTLFIDEEDLGLMPGFFGDDLDALELDTEPSPYTYFSVDFLSPTLDPTDLWASLGDGNIPFLYADGETEIGLFPEDDIDALILFDLNLNNKADPGIDKALFSLSTFSPSSFTFSGNSYIAGRQGFLSPADILFTDFTGSFSLWASAADIGLDELDELDALDTIPEPGSLILLVSGLLGLVVTKKRV